MPMGMAVRRKRMARNFGEQRHEQAMRERERESLGFVKRDFQEKNENVYSIPC